MAGNELNRVGKPLHKATIVLHVPMWLLKGTIEWMIRSDRHLNPVRLETSAYPIRYRMRLVTPKWAASMCRSVADGSDIPKEERRGQMIQHTVVHEHGDELRMQGETRVDGAPLVRTDFEYQPAGNEVRCSMWSGSLQARYGGILANVASNMQQTLVVEQRAIEARARVVGMATLFALRLAFGAC
jgi:hypothetical protein